MGSHKACDFFFPLITTDKVGLLAAVEFYGLVLRWQHEEKKLINHCLLSGGQETMPYQSD